MIQCEWNMKLIPSIHGFLAFKLFLVDFFVGRFFIIMMNNNLAHFVCVRLRTIHMNDKSCLAVYFRVPNKKIDENCVVLFTGFTS